MAENFFAEAFSLLAISLIFIALRIYSRWTSVGFRQLAADDYLMVVAGVSTLSSQLRQHAGLNRERTVVVYGRDGGCILCRRILARTGEQQHDPRTTSGPRPGLGGVDA